MLFNRENDLRAIFDDEDGASDMAGWRRQSVLLDKGTRVGIVTHVMRQNGTPSRGLIPHAQSSDLSVKSYLPNPRILGIASRKRVCARSKLECLNFGFDQFCSIASLASLKLNMTVLLH